MKKAFLCLILLCINLCYAAEITILHTSDTHGRISPIEYKGKADIGGLSRRIYIFNKTKSDSKNYLLLDSGDVFQGSIYYRIDKGLLNAKLLPYLNYDAIALGNHEFDDGLKILKRNIKASKTQFLSANVHFKDKYLKTHVKPYIVKEFDGEKFLIIGVTTQSLKNLTTTGDITVTNPIYEIKKIIKNVDYDKLIILSHCGLEEDQRIANAIENIDIILGGHNHFFFEYPKYINKTPIIQDGEFGVRVGKIIFDKKLKSYSYLDVDSKYPKENRTDSIISKADKKINKDRNKIVATTTVDLIGDQTTIEHCQTNLGKLVLISMTKPFKDYDAVITNSGSIRINRNLTDKITYADLMEILPFENKIVLVELQGKYLKQCLYEGKIQTNRRFLQVYLKDKNIDDNKTYKVITNDYIAAGKDGYKSLAHCKVIKKAKEKPVKLLYTTLKDISPITNDNIKF